MQRTNFRRIMASGVLAIALFATSAPAQNAPGAGVQGDASTVPADDDNGMDLGWLGLLGLAGLLGLRRKEEHHVTRVDTTTGTASSSTRPRV